MKTVKLRMLLEVKQDYTDQEFLDLYPESAVKDDTAVVTEVENQSLSGVGPEQYVETLQALGARFGISVQVTSE